MIDAESSLRGGMGSMEMKDDADMNDMKMEHNHEHK